ncbi:MAG: PIN domain-containing protein [Actinobacteria bacterium]|nr:PIN domain-containing protein [Actinomycetota bacterium]
MTLIDTSAWVEYLRDSNSATCNEVDRLLNSELALCDAVRMELLAGARDEQHVAQIEKLLARATVIKTESIDYDNAAAIYRACRKLGLTIRTHIDCLIAAIAIRDCQSHDVANSHSRVSWH